LDFDENFAPNPSSFPLPLLHTLVEERAGERRLPSQFGFIWRMGDASL
jgi:hypothetical protein